MTATEQTIPTPDEFLDMVKSVLRHCAGDTEKSHVKTDEIMEELLIELGYSDGVAEIRSSGRWYA